MVIAGGALREKGKYAGIAASLIERVTVPADAVLLVEGDGSRRKPMKAPTSGEPVIPASTDVVFAIMGASAFDEPIDAECCYNPEGALDLLGKTEGIGAVLAKGFEEAVRVFGKATAPYVMAVRNEGLAAHDPRWHASLALTYYYDPTPARHTQGSLAFPLAGYTVEGVTAR